MGRKSKFSYEYKIKYIQRYIEEKDSIRHTASLAGIGPKTLRLWIDNYQSLGSDGLNWISLDDNQAES